MNFRDRLADVLAIIAFCLAVLQLTYPSALGGTRISPVLLITLALLVAARRAVRRQVKKRAEMLKEVPKRPLGLSDESRDSH